MESELRLQVVFQADQLDQAQLLFQPVGVIFFSIVQLYAQDFPGHVVVVPLAKLNACMRAAEAASESWAFYGPRGASTYSCEVETALSFYYHSNVIADSEMFCEAFRLAGLPNVANSYR